ncbi:MAG: hypothetical protein RL112_1116 [Planctomycetota bacterium]
MRLHPTTLLALVACTSSAWAQAQRAAPIETTRLAADGQTLVHEVHAEGRPNSTPPIVLRDGPLTPRAHVAPEALSRALHPQAAHAPREAADATLSNPLDSLRWTGEDGALWVRGADYKASFDATGATFVPFLGSDEPRNWPLSARLVAAEIGGEELAVGAFGHARQGDAVALERGLVDEVWELRLREVEQTFVVESLPRQGDLTLKVAFSGDLAAVATPDGWLFANAKGEGVRCGKAFLRLADGSKKPLAASMDGDELVIVVPADLIAAAGFPLVVDPVLATYAVDDTSFDNLDADVAYDPEGDSWLHVYEEVFSATDSDVYARRRLPNGTLQEVGYAQVGTAFSWRAPRVAYQRTEHLYMIVAEASHVNDLGHPDVMGRVWDVGTGWQPWFYVAAPAVYAAKSPDIGGDPYQGAPGEVSYFCVTWKEERTEFSPRHAIRARLLQHTGSPATEQFFVDSGDELREHPSVSNSNGTTRWGLSWSRGDHGVGFASISWNGAQVRVQPQLALTWERAAGARTSIGNLGHYAATSPERGFVIGYPSRINVGASFNWAITAVLDEYMNEANSSATRTSTPSQPTNFVEDLTLDCDDSTTVLNWVGRRPDGQTWVQQAYKLMTVDHTDAGSAYAYWTSSLAVFSTNAKSATRVATKYSSGGAKRVACASWTQAATTGRDVLAALTSWNAYPMIEVKCNQGSSSTTACPCGSAGTGSSTPDAGCPNSATSGATLTPFGNAALGAGNDTLAFIVGGLPPTTSCLVFQGTNVAQLTSGGITSYGTVFGDGLRCANGSIVRLGTGTSSGGNLLFPPAGTASLSTRGGLTGPTTRSYQVWYRNASAFCTPSTFNLTNGLVVHWIPAY